MFASFSIQKIKFAYLLLLWSFTINAAEAFQLENRAICGIDNPLLAADEQIACLGEPYGNWIIQLKEASPEKDAIAQVEKGEFKLLEIVHAWGGPSIPGIECFVRWPREELHGSLFFSDAIDGQADWYWREWAERYIARFNQAIVSNSKFPYQDLCMPIEGEIQQNRIRKSQPNLTFEKWIARTSAVSADGTITSAARLRDSNTVNGLLATNPESVYHKDIFGFSALEWAVLHSDQGLVENLIAHGSNVNGIGKNPIRPLYLAIAIRNEGLVRLLLNNGADPNSSSYSVSNLRAANDEFYSTQPLSMAAQLGELGIVKALLATGAKVDGQSSIEAPIFQAIEKNHSDVLRILLDTGADVSVRDRSRIAPIQTAAERKNYNALKLLMDANSSKLARSDFEQKIWEKAYKTQHYEILSHVVAFGTNVNLANRAEQRKLLTAVRRNKLDDVKSLLASLDERFENLKLAITQGDLSSVQAIFRDRAKPIRNYAYSELAAALEDGQSDIAIWLLDQGANPDAEIVPSKLEWILQDSIIGKNNYGSPTTPENRKMRVGLIKSKRGRVLPNKVHDLAFMTGPIELTKAVAEKSNIDDKVVQWTNFSAPLHSALFGFRDHKDIAILDYALQYDDIAIDSVRADLFLSKLCFWTMRENIEAFSYYIEKGYLPHQETPKNQKGFLSRKENALNECIGRDARAAIVLLEKGADPNQRNRIGEPALHTAITEIGSYNEAYPYEHVVKLLLEKGADPTTTHAGRNAFDIAQRRIRYIDGKHIERLEYVIQLLADYGLSEPAKKCRQMTLINSRWKNMYCQSLFNDDGWIYF